MGRIGWYLTRIIHFLVLYAMRHGYLLILLLMGGLRAQGQAPAWQPFRPGFIYSFSASSPTPPIAVHTLRVDSAYATPTGDSVYAFNRLLRPRPGSSYPLLKSRNNLLGARLRWRPGTADYYLEANAEPALGGPAAPVVVLLRPRAAVGSTWVAAATPALTATLTSRTLDSAGATPDSVATVTLSNGQVLRLSQHYGLLQGPQWLSLPVSGPLPPTWQQYGAPQPGLGPYDPRALFALGVGDEVGHELTSRSLGALPCERGYRLRRILGREQTADSLFITYSQQDQVTTTNPPGCSGTPGTVLGAVQRGRWAFSLRTGASPQWPSLGLLAGEYRPLFRQGSSQALLMGQGYDPSPGVSACLLDQAPLVFMAVYPTAAAADQYEPGLDYLAINQKFGPTLGIGPTFFVDYQYENRLDYYRRGAVSCGQAANYATLLPTRAALPAATATLAPNPAAEAATLTLAAPAPAGTTLALTDALGRRVWSAPVPAGQTALPLSLAMMPAGVYLMQLLVPGAPPLTWKLDH